jgi:hypothetical protein
VRNRVLVIAVLATVVAGAAAALSGGGGHVAPARAGVAPAAIARAPCAQPDLAHAPLPQEAGIYRAGPLLLAIGEDLAQLPAAQLAGGSGSDVIAVVSGGRAVTVSVLPSVGPSSARFAFQFAAPGASTEAVRFPACGGRTHRFGGGISFGGAGCARLRVTPAGGPASTMLIPVGNTLRGCPSGPSRRGLTPASLPFLGVACGVPNLISCGRVGIGVALKRPAMMVTVQLAGHVVALAPPPADSPGDIEWMGYLYDNSFRRGPLDVHVPPGVDHWAGGALVQAPVRVSAFFADGSVASVSGQAMLHPGYG